VVPFKNLIVRYREQIRRGEEEAEREEPNPTKVILKKI